MLIQRLGPIGLEGENLAIKLLRLVLCVLASIN